MCRLIKIEISRAFRNHWLLIPVVIGCLLAIWHIAYEVLPAVKWVGDNDRWGPPTVFNRTLGIIDSMPSLLFFYCLPLLAAMPYAGSYYTDTKSGFAKNVIIRSRKSHYLLAKVIATFLSGATVSIVPLLLCMYISSMLLPSVLILPFSGNSPLSPQDMWYTMYMSNPYLYLLLYFCITSTFAGLFALFGLTISHYVSNSFLVLVTPFILFVFSNTLFGSLGLGFLCPYDFMRPMQLGNSSQNLTVLLLLIIATIMLLLSLTPFFMKGLRDETF